MPRFSVTTIYDAVDQAEACAIRSAIDLTLKMHGAISMSSAPAALAILPQDDPAESAPQTVWSDGGCDRADGIGAWAFIYQAPNGERIERFGAAIETTNNLMEMRAVIEGLAVCEIGVRVHIVVDSEYVLKGATVWSRRWVLNGWQTSEFKPVKNREQWQHLLQLLALHHVTWEHVRGHTGHPENERCDELCTRARLKAVAAICDGEEL